MANFQIAYQPYDEYDENPNYYYFVYDKDETDSTHYGTCRWTIKVCHYKQCKTLKTAQKWLKYYQELYR